MPGINTVIDRLRSNAKKAVAGQVYRSNSAAELWDSAVDLFTKFAALELEDALTDSERHLFECTRVFLVINGANEDILDELWDNPLDQDLKDKIKDMA